MCLKLITLFVIMYMSLIYKPKINVRVDSELNLNNLNLCQNETVFIHENFWSITIPKINLEKVKIKESVSTSVLENYIGHFPNSSILEGNVCLAAHNNGYSNNYFKDINLLDVGDKIYYSYNGNNKVYSVAKKKIINYNDFSYLDFTDNDTLTLITCINSSPNFRLCIQAVCEEEFNENI